MELLQLKYFCDAAKTENFSKTAKKYNVPPSNISQSIKRLEKELETTLFNRKSNSLTLSSQGEIFYNKISEALKLIDDAKCEISPKQNQAILKICVLTNRTVLMETVEEFNKIYPDIIIIASYNTPQVDEDFDIIISDSDFTNKNTEKEVVIAEEFCVAINKKNPLSQKNVITGDDLSHESFISMNKESSIFSSTEKICRQMNFTPNIIMESPEPAFIRKCIELNLGITFFPEISWKGLFSENVAIKKLNGFCRTTYAYKNKSSKKIVDNFLEILKNNFK